MILDFNLLDNSCKSKLLNSFHSVININASASSSASYLDLVKIIFSSSSSLLNVSIAFGSYALILAPLFKSSLIIVIEGALLTSSVWGLNESPIPQMLNYLNYHQILM